MDDETDEWMNKSRDGKSFTKMITTFFTIWDLMHRCVYLTVHITKLQIDENINIVIEFNPYMPKFSK